jgi:hypothetical protein
MLSWFRTHASRIAALAMVALAAVGASAASPHLDDCHDSACLALAAESNDDASRVVAPPADDDLHSLHCLVCHWARSFRPQIEASVVSTPGAGISAAHQVEFVTASGAARAVQPPLRAPPVSPFV